MILDKLWVWYVVDAWNSQVNRGPVSGAVSVFDEESSQRMPTIENHFKTLSRYLVLCWFQITDQSKDRKGAIKLWILSALDRERVNEPHTFTAASQRISIVLIKHEKCLLDLFPFKFLFTTSNRHILQNTKILRKETWIQSGRRLLGCQIVPERDLAKGAKTNLWSRLSLYLSTQSLMNIIWIWHCSTGIHLFALLRHRARFRKLRFLSTHLLEGEGSRAPPRLKQPPLFHSHTLCSLCLAWP